MTAPLALVSVPALLERAGPRNYAPTAWRVYSEKAMVFVSKELESDTITLHTRNLVEGEWSEQGSYIGCVDWAMKQGAGRYLVALFRLGGRIGGRWIGEAATVVTIVDRRPASGPALTGWDWSEE